MAAGTRYLTFARAGSIAPQQLAQGSRSGAMRRGPYRHLDRFQVESAGLAQFLKDTAEQCVYFALNFPLDDFGSFFSCGVRVSSTGLARQISSLISIRVRFSS